MTTIVLTLLLDRELQKINRLIDYKIEHHQSYKSEAALHKKIVSRLNKLKKNKSVLAVL
jgi:hypothetical protein